MARLRSIMMLQERTYRNCNVGRQLVLRILSYSKCEWRSPVHRAMDLDQPDRIGVES